MSPPKPTKLFLRLCGGALFFLLLGGEGIAKKPPKYSHLKPIGSIKVLLLQGGSRDIEKAAPQLKLSPGQVAFKGKSFQFVGGRATFKTDEALRFKSNDYTGLFIVERSVGKKGGWLLINQVPMELYLVGVLVGEISPNWSDAAIQAQAIAARSYAYHLIERNKDKPYHIHSTVRAQVFHGTHKIHPNLRKNIEQTRHMLLTSRHKPIMSFFSASCGGTTERAHVVWKTTPKNLPYFQNIRCHYCTTHPYYRWEVFVPMERLNQALQPTKPKSVEGDVHRFRVLKTSSSKRVQQIQIFTTKGDKWTLEGNDFRRFVGTSVLKSLAFSMKRSQKGVHFKGKGFGHGVGLCQWGAKTMAERGYNAKAILKFYYKNTRLIGLR